MNLIHMIMMMIKEYITPDDYGPPPDNDLDMPGIQDSGETHNPDVPTSRLLILDKMMILHQDLILLLNQVELILMMLYQRQRLR